MISALRTRTRQQYAVRVFLLAAAPDSRLELPETSSIWVGLDGQHHGYQVVGGMTASTRTCSSATTVAGSVMKRYSIKAFTLSPQKSPKASASAKLWDRMETSRRAGAEPD